MKLGAVAKVASGDWWLTPRYNEFVVSQRNLANERAALSRILDRPERFRANTWSASGAGRCLRERQLSFLGFPERRQDPQTMNIFANGDYVHLRHQVAGIIGGYLKEVEYPVASPEHNVLGTLDGVTSHECGAEFKSINSRGFSNVMTYGIKFDHMGQMTSYMVASGLRTFYILYENKDTNEMREFRYDYDKQKAAEVIRDLDTLNENTADKKLLPMLDECVARTGRFNRCQFKEVCPTAQFGPSESRRRIRVVPSSDSA